MASNPTNSFVKTMFLTGLALIAFAANSVLCRSALGQATIDAASFTMIRLISGITALWFILLIRNGNKKQTLSGSWTAAAMLFLYAVAFSFAYISLETGTGALILFAAVQLTMILIALFKGERLGIIAWLGILIAFSGFIYLILPGVSRPSFVGFLLMTIAGVAWGVYTIFGKGSARPLADTTLNFTRTLPFMLVMTIFTFPFLELSIKGIVLAILSGAIASGLGYTIWYTALKGLSAAQAAVVQLLVPVIAATGGVVFIAEVITFRLVISAVMILGGVTMVLKWQN